MQSHSFLISGNVRSISVVTPVTSKPRTSKTLSAGSNEGVTTNTTTLFNGKLRTNFRLKATFHNSRTHTIGDEEHQSGSEKRKLHFFRKIVCRRSGTYGLVRYTDRGTRNQIGYSYLTAHTPVTLNGRSNSGQHMADN